MEEEVDTNDSQSPDTGELKIENPEKQEAKKQAKIITHETAEEIENEFDDQERESQEKVEAALFISGKFLTIQDLIMLTDINPIMLREILNKLEKRYSKGAIQLINRNSSWKMDVSEKYNYLVNRLATGTAEFTKAEQETLAVIAYKQPVKQSVIIKIRGNKAYDHIKKFRETGLVTAKSISHTLELSLSEDFYEYFSLANKQAFLQNPGDKGKEPEQEQLEDENQEEPGDNE